MEESGLHPASHASPSVDMLKGQEHQEIKRCLVRSVARRLDQQLDAIRADGVT